MPAADPADQEAARALESALRAAVQGRERSPVELRWLMALPKRIRRSGRLLDAAVAESLVLLEHIRAEWNRAQEGEREREKRLTRAKALPRDIECLRAPDPKAWNGLGRRKNRCRTFEAIGRAYTARQRTSPTLPSLPTSQQPPVVACLSVDVEPPSSPLLGMPDAPTRPPTPEGLREAAFSCVGLLASASGVNPYGHNTPCPMPPPPPLVIRRPPSPTAPPQPQLAYEGETVINGQAVDCRLAYLIALGRWESCKWARAPSLREAAEDVLNAETLQPGALSYLMGLFFPHGLDDWSSARPRLLYLRDLVAGWYAVAPT
ncbi:hypothetical protein RhiJN_03367 [Ceratobasidium sp. AG-Ba]|nr:hypothetical protein RhiJN_03367 [Ceratobasidium sp. AG-Ba]